MSHDGRDPEPAPIPRSWGAVLARVLRAYREATLTHAPEPYPESEPEPEPVPEPVAVEAPPTEAAAPRFEVRALAMPKRGNTEDEWEDAFAFDAGRGVVAVCDGASDGIFSKLWANLLARSFVADPIDLEDPSAVGAWVRGCRGEWARGIDYPSLRWSLQLRVDRSCGAATFLGFRLLDDHPDDPDAPCWRAWAVGDICLFWVRGRQLLQAFPVQNAGEFGTTPPLFRSKPMGPDPSPVSASGECRPGDLFLIATDALAQRLLLWVEEGCPPDWERFWSVAPDEWRHEVEALRDRNQIVNDDCTLLAVRITGDPAPVPEVVTTVAVAPLNEPESSEILSP